MNELNNVLKYLVGGVICLSFVIVPLVNKCHSTFSKEPVVTSKVKYSDSGAYYDSDGHLQMRPAMYKMYDSNKLCPNGYGGDTFVIISSGGKISKDDKCAYCGYTWKKHDDA